MRCASETDRLWEYLDGELPPEEAAAVRRHLTGCPLCRRRARCYRALLRRVERAARCVSGAPRWLRAELRCRCRCD